MVPVPRLVPIAPTAGEPATISRSPFWIGAAAGNALRLFLPGVAPKHASILERENGYWLSPYPHITPAPRVNGQTVAEPVQLRDGAIIEFLPGARYEFVSGVPRLEPVAPPTEPEPAYAEPPEPGRRKRRRRRRTRAGGSGVPWGAVAAIVLLAGGVIGAAWWAYHAFVREKPESEQEVVTLSQADYTLYDSLLTQSYEHMERGAIMLGLGLTDGALTEFARAVNVFEESRLRTNPLIRPRIEAIKSTVLDIYRFRNTELPAAFRGLRHTGFRLASTLKGSLNTAQFAVATEQVQQSFVRRFQKRYEITGQDHPEHTSLYGPGGALDIRVRGLSTAEIGFLITNFRGLGVRVKDFSTDTVLQAQIAAAKRAGLADRAGTGLHLHVDRFANRMDPYTVR